MLSLGGPAFKKNNTVTLLYEMAVSFKWLVMNNVEETWWLNGWLAGVAHGPILISYINLACFALGCNKETRANKY